MVFKPIRPKKVSAQIAEQIRSSILAGEFAPGDKLPPERELAEMFGVSRPSVREALNILTSSGLVEEDHRNLFLHHRAVFEAIRDRDAERAWDTMLTHLTFAEHRSSAYVTQQQK